MLSDSNQNISNGKLSQGIEIDSSIRCVIDFIESNFIEFSKKIKGEIDANEKALTDKLCKFLNRNANGYPFYFHHENIENHSSGRSPQTDIGTLSENEKIIIGDKSYNEFDSFFSIEAKRLPTPGHNREKEYVIGIEKPNGGIERFKKGIHGNNLKYSAIIGYIQNNDSNHWFLKINEWIRELISSDPNFWKEDDILLPEKTKQEGINKYHSKNFRTIVDKKEEFIELFHFWIDIQ
jgi:hypothetical protein